MNKAEKALKEIRELDSLNSKKSFVHSLSPLSKILVTLIYIVATVSLPKYSFFPTFVMGLFPLTAYQFSLISVRTCFKKLKYILPLVCFIGIFNPFLDREIVIKIVDIGISGGIISMFTLMMKGVFCLMASFLLVATTSTDEIAMALGKIHCPKIIITLFLLTVRYISLFVEEIANMTNAYHLRSNKQKGIHISAWGSFLGQLILRSYDRATSVYESMCLRGFSGEVNYYSKEEKNKCSWLIALIVVILILVCRFINIANLLGANL